MTTSSYPSPRPRRRRARPKSGTERNAAYRTRTSRLRQMMLMAGAMHTGPVSMIELTCRDQLTRDGWNDIFHRWADHAVRAGLVTWVIAIYHDRGPSGRRVRPHLHLLCDLHDDARRSLRLHAAHKTPRYRRWNTVKLDQHGLTLGTLAHRAGIGHKTHWRIIDNGGPTYLHGRQWTGREAWKHNRQRVSTFVPHPNTPLHREILDAMRAAPTDEQAIEAARTLLMHHSTRPDADPSHPPAAPLPPSAAAARQARMLARTGIISTWLWNRCTASSPQPFRARDLPVMCRAQALADIHDYCDQLDLTRPSRRDFTQAMDTTYTTENGYWLGITLQAHPTLAADVGDFPDPTPPDPNAPPIQAPQMPGMTDTARPTPRPQISAGPPPPPTMSPERTQQQRRALEANPGPRRPLMA